ncbi:hypothetical protein [Cupriavidus alkaliphilus]|uniref:hypothetical protein n=1 Tax=Cupriavidus alkaliphilus TaxID=942866 RepID=UPI000DC42E99|nr:hypothetical protein [Cupriavidus alkaliphilus]RAS05009.1 hypothetical protein C7415_109115 [Cupriavidus alkaliphilus]
MSIQMAEESLSATAEQAAGEATCETTVHALLGELRAVMGAYANEEADSTARHQQLLLWVSLVGMAAALVFNVIANRGGPAWTAYVSLILLLTGTVASVGYGIAGAKGFIKEWRTLEADMLDGAGKRMHLWYETIAKLRATYTPDQMSFAQDYISAVSAQLRSRLGYVIGALDKVGLIPLIGSVAVTLAKFFQEGQLPFIWSEAAIAAGIFYVIALRFIGVTYTLDRLAVILKHAAKRQEGSSESAREP